MITIHFFAGLKRFFPEPIEFNYTKGETASDLIERLKQQQPEASNLLDNCRAALNEEFVDLATPIPADTALFLIPPSSGG